MKRTKDRGSSSAENRHNAVIHSILGLALLYLAGVLLLRLVAQVHASGVTVTVVVSAVGVVIFCVIGGMLLGGVLIRFFRGLAAKRKSKQEDQPNG